MSTDATTDEEPPLAARFGKLRDWVHNILEGRVADNEADIEALQQRVDDLDGRVADLEAQLEDRLGVADDQRSTPDARAEDLREALIRAAESRDVNRVRWWWHEVADTLSTLGHDGFTKTTYHNTMKQAVEEGSDAFTMETKRTETNDGRMQDVMAIQVDRRKLRRSGAETASNQLTTGSGEGTGSTTTTDAAATPD